MTVQVPRLPEGDEVPLGEIFTLIFCYFKALARYDYTLHAWVAPIYLTSRLRSLCTYVSTTDCRV